MTKLPSSSSKRRNNANDVDLNHPWIASIYPPRLLSEQDNNNNNNKPMQISNEMLCIENGNAALDVLQSFIDSLVDLGRMDDLRLGRRFFEEWTFAASSSSSSQLQEEDGRIVTNKKKNHGKRMEQEGETTTTTLSSPTKKYNAKKKDHERYNESHGPEPQSQDYYYYNQEEEEEEVVEKQPSYKKKKKKDKKKKRKKDKKSSSSSSRNKRKYTEEKIDNDDHDGTTSKSQPQPPSKPFSNTTKNKGAALSLHNCASISTATFHAMVAANVGSVLSTLDLTGVHSLTDDLFVETIVSSCKGMRRLSLKNCRKITGLSLKAIAVGLPKLQAIDVGGSFNILPTDVIHLVKHHPNTQTSQLTEIYASGLGWSDTSLRTLLSFCCSHIRGLSIGFSPLLSSETLVELLGLCGETLERLGLHFVDCVDNGVLEALGGVLRGLCALDVRGCGGVSSLNGMMESRFDYGSVIGGGGGDEDGGGGVEGGEKKKKKKRRRLEEKHDVYEEDRKHDIRSRGGGEGEGEDMYQRHLFVLARYSGITKKSLEETRRIHRHVVQQRQLLGGGSGRMSSLELPLTCILDGEGTGGGIRR